MLKDLLRPDVVLILEEKTRDAVLKKMVEHLQIRGEINQTDQFYNAVLARESLASTGIGMGIALPHAKQKHFKHFVISFAALSHPVDWNSIDQSPVRAVFLIGGPEEQQKEYLKLLSEITQCLKDEEKRKKLFTLKSSQDIVNFFED